LDTLIAFDPGGTTGWCRFERMYGNTWRVNTFGQFSTDQMKRIPELIVPGDMVVFERIHMLHLGFDPIGLEVIGAIKMWCQIEGNTYIGQSPGILSGAKVWPDLDEARKWFKGQQHALDAFYHGVTYLGLKSMNMTKPPIGQS